MLPKKRKVHVCTLGRTVHGRVSTVRFSEYVCEAELRSRKKDSEREQSEDRADEL